MASWAWGIAELNSAAPLITLWRHGRLPHANAWDQGRLARGPYSGLPPRGWHLATPVSGRCPAGTEAQGVPYEASLASLW